MVQISALKAKLNMHIYVFLIGLEILNSSISYKWFFFDSPNLLISSLEFLQKNTNKIIGPANGINPININHGVFPISCNLLIPKGKETKKTSIKKTDKIISPKISINSIINPIIIPIMKEHKTTNKYQQKYSLLSERFL